MTPAKSQNLLDKLGLKDLPLSDQEDVLLTLNDLVFRSSLVRLIERMSDAERDTFSHLIDSEASEAELDAFLKTVNGSETVVKEALDELTDDILAVS